MINMDTYVKARKLGLKEYHARMQRNENPFLAALEEQVEELNALARVELGLQQIPLRKIMGTATKSRTNAFAANFMMQRTADGTAGELRTTVFCRVRLATRMLS